MEKKKKNNLEKFTQNEKYEKNLNIVIYFISRNIFQIFIPYVYRLNILDIQIYSLKYVIFLENRCNHKERIILKANVMKNNEMNV